MGRGIDSRNRFWNSVAKLHRLAGRYVNPMPIWFLAPIAGLKLPTLTSMFDMPPPQPLEAPGAAMPQTTEGISLINRGLATLNNLSSVHVQGWKSRQRRTIIKEFHLLNAMVSIRIQFRWIFNKLSFWIRILSIYQRFKKCQEKNSIFYAGSVINWHQDTSKIKLWIRDLDPDPKEIFTDPQPWLKD